MPQLKAIVYIAFEGPNAGWQRWCTQTKSTREERLNSIYQIFEREFTEAVRVVLAVYKTADFSLSIYLWGVIVCGLRQAELPRWLILTALQGLPSGTGTQHGKQGAWRTLCSRSWGYLWTWVFVSPLALIQDSGKLPSILWSPRQWQCLVQLSVQR